MDLPNLFSSSPKKDKLFLGLILTQQSVQSILWKVANGDISIIKTSSIFSFEKTEEMLIKTDQALQELGELSENLSEVIFGLESSWVNQKGIIEEKKTTLKKLTTDLSLKPVGFVVITDAIIQTLAKNEPHFSSLLLFYTKEKISVALVEKGVVQKTESVGRSHDSVGDLTEALARFPHTKDKKLPKKINLIAINIDKNELYDQQQNLLSVDWVEKGYFPSTPNIESLEEDIVISSVIKQGGKAVARAQGLEITKQKTKPPETQPSDFSFKEVKINNNQVEEKNPNKDELAVTEPTTPTTSKSTQFSFGIPINSTKLPNINKPQKETAVMVNKPMENNIPLQKKLKSNQTKKWLKSHRTFASIGFFSGIITLVLIGFIALISTSTAIITLDLSPQNINKDVSIVLNPKITNSDFEKLILKSELVTKTVSTGQTNETTGTTLVGEKSSGKVEIWNKTDSEKSLQAGTSFASGATRFTLNDDITVASSSTKENESTGEITTTPGKTEANLTAVAIGAESNLEKDTKLTIDSFATSSYEANVIESFSGGSSREIRVISEDDQSKLLDELKKKLLEIANMEFQDDSSGEKTFISTNTLKISNSVYSGEVGDESKTLNLDLTAEVEAIVYQKADLKPLAEAVLKDLVPEGFEITEKDPQILSDISDKNASGSAITIDANLSTQAIPIINLNSLKNEISTQSISSAKAILTGKKEIKSFEIKLMPSILEKIWKKLPGKSEKIEIKIS